MKNYSKTRNPLIGITDSLRKLYDEIAIKKASEEKFINELKTIFKLK